MQPVVTMVIMAGGKGERLWPLVRTAAPKVCVPVDGSRSLLALTLDRVRGVAPRQDTLIVTSAAQARPVSRAVTAADRRAVVAEPEPRNTAACIALATALASARDPNGILVVLPADHWITPTASFRRSLHVGIDLAKAHDRMVMLGLTPTRVHPGLGHLCTSPHATTRRGCDVFELTRFVEKPTVEQAEQLMAQHRVHWNAGIFIGRVKTFERLISQWLPNHAKRIFPLGEGPRSTLTRRAAAVYPAVDPISFDHGVMAHVDEGFVVGGGYAWEDLGSWDSLARMSQFNAPLVAVQSRNACALSTDRAHLVAVVGVDDVIVVHTPDATLVCRADQAQAVRAAVGQLGTRRALRRYL